jgi:type I restriction enzyme S subunit
MSNPHWPLVPLGELISHRKQFFTIDDNQTYKRCRVQLAARGVVLRDIVSGSDIKTKEQQACQEGDFLVAEIDAKLGGYGIVPKELDGAIVSSHYFLFTINEQRLDREFLGWYSKTPEFFEQVSAQGSTNYAAVRPHQVLNYVIPAPSLSTQREVVARLNTAQRLQSEIADRISDVTKEMSLILRNFIHSSKERGGSLVTVGDFMKLKAADTNVDPEQEYPLAGVYSFGRGVFVTKTIRGSETRYKIMSKLKTDDFVYPKLMAWEGALGVVPEDCDSRYVSPEFCVFEIDKTVVLPRIVDVYFRDPQAWPLLQSASTGTNVRRRRLYPEDFLQLQMPVPSRADQQIFDTLSRNIDGAGSLQTQSVAELDRLMPAILDQAFNSASIEKL